MFICPKKNKIICISSFNFAPTYIFILIKSCLGVSDATYGTSSYLKMLCLSLRVIIYQRGFILVQGHIVVLIGLLYQREELKGSDENFPPDT